MRKTTMRILWTFLAWLALLGVGHADAPPIAPDEARPHVSWEDADRVVGRVAFVSGRVADVRKFDSLTLINFFADHPPAEFSGVIRTADLAKFSPSPKELYRGKIVRIRGLVTTFKGVPQIAITSPDQIEVLEELPATEEPPARAKHAVGAKIKVAAYNVLNLFDAVDDPYTADEATPIKPREQLESLAESIRQLDADVIALEEVENRGYLERFIEVFLTDMGYEHVVLFEGNDRRGIDVALLSRVPIGQVRSNRHVTFPGPNGRTLRFARDVLQVNVEPENAAGFEIWVVHLQSNSQGREYAEPIRIAEARQVRRMLDQELKQDPAARIVVTGDFNDTWNSEALQTIAGQGATAMWATATDNADGAVITYNQGPFREMIDFALCSPAMAKRFVKGSFHVEPGSPETTGSDHNPIVAEFDLQKAP
ncbi:MAG: endonuclease/exonuclease/phosphatase family protein [Pirellulales bacterium]